MLLRQSERTVSELAESLGLTDNAVRSHLASLGRDGLVRPSGTRRGAFKPHTTYALTPEADFLFPTPYGAVLRAVFEALSVLLHARRVKDIARAAGRRLAAGHATAPPGSGLRERAGRALSVLAELGGQGKVESSGRRYVVRGLSCPLASVVAEHPAVCGLVEALLAEVAGVPVREHCRRGESPQCQFEVG
jgi:predicted ArsR family transcriptional regulator